MELRGTSFGQTKDFKSSSNKNSRLDKRMTQNVAQKEMVVANVQVNRSIPDKEKVENFSSLCSDWLV